jgi:hypothetical protein
MALSSLKKWFKRENRSGQEDTSDDRGDEFPPAARAESRRTAVERAILKALPEGWTVSQGGLGEKLDRASGRELRTKEWMISSARYDLGHYDIRLTDDLQQLIFVHSTEIHCFPPDIEEACLIRLDAYTLSGLSLLLRKLIDTRRPILVHPT